MEEEPITKLAKFVRLLPVPVIVPVPVNVVVCELPSAPAW